MNDAAVQRGARDEPHALVEGLLAGQMRSLSRAITAVENATEASAPILAAIAPHLGRAYIVGVTGPPGSGKSTLIAALIDELRRRAKTVGVLAVDPSSPISGGAILGDRVRMAAHTVDPGVFVRSLASRGHLGGLTRTARDVLQVMDAYGPDIIILETVGAGQSEVEIADFAHTRVVLCAPGAGDDVQALKAGILEIADILVVNKGDHPQAAQTLSQLRAMLALRTARATPTQLLCTTATSGQGVAELVDVLLAAAARVPPASRRPDVALQARHRLADAAAQRLRAHVLAGGETAIDAVCAELARGELTLDQAVDQALAALAATGAVDR